MSFAVRRKSLPIGQAFLALDGCSRRCAGAIVEGTHPPGTEHLVNVDRNAKKPTLKRESIRTLSAAELTMVGGGRRPMTKTWRESRKCTTLTKETIA